MKESDNLQAEPRVLICRSGIRFGSQPQRGANLQMVSHLLLVLDFKSTGRNDRISHQYRYGHGPNAPRYWGNPPGNGPARIAIADHL